MTPKERSRVISLLLVSLMIFSAFTIINFAAAPASATGILTVTIASDINPADAYQTIYFNASASFPAGDGTYGFYYKVLGSGGSMTMAQNTTSSTWETDFQGADTYLVKVVAVQTSDVASGWAEMNETVDNQLTVSASASHTTIDKGMSVTFSSTVSGGASPYTYRWYLNGSAVSGATSSTWTTSTLPTGNPTIYVKVTDSNSFTVQSNTITETVNPPLTVSISSSKNPIDYGMSVTFNSNVTGGTPPYSYQWSLNGANVTGATSSTWTTDTLPVGNDSIRLWVTDSAGDPEPGHPNSSMPVIIIGTDTQWTGPEDSGWTVYLGAPFGFYVDAIGTQLIWNLNTSDYRFQWFENSRPIANATGKAFHTVENTPGTYKFAVRVTSDSPHAGYKGVYWGFVTENVTASNYPANSVIFTESGLPNGTIWSAALYPPSNRTYPQGTSVGIQSSFFTTVTGPGLPAIVIIPPSGTWEFYVTFFAFNKSLGFLMPSSNFTADPAYGLVTTSNASKGPIVIRVQFTPKNTQSNSSGEATSLNSTLTNLTQNMSSNATTTGILKHNITSSTSASNSTVPTVHGTILPKNNTNATLMIRTFPIFKRAPTIVNFVLFIPIVFGLVIRRASHKKQRNKEAQD